MEIFYNASHLWTAIHYKLYYARNIIMTGGINYLILNRFPGGRIDLLYVAWNKIQSAAMFNATFFIILQAYVKMATDDEASCWAKWSWVFFFFFFKALLITGSGKLFVTFVKVLLETQRLAAETVLAQGMCEYAKHLSFCSYRVSTWKHKIVWKPFALQGLHGEKPHRAELCKNVWCRFLSWAYATFCFRETVFVRWSFFTELQLWPWGGRAGQGQQLSSPLWALWHAWPDQKHKVSKKIPTMLLSSQILPHVTLCTL